jgi:hypothetical protein
MHSQFAIRIPKPRLVLPGFYLFLAKVGGIFGLWLGLWAVLAASTALETPRAPQPIENNPRWSLLSPSHLSPGER